MSTWDNVRCQGCECEHTALDLEKNETVIVCELIEVGEPCYMPNDSYNPTWKAKT